MGHEIHIVHVVLSLDVGGLERNIVNQVRERHALGQRVSVVCLERPGVLASQVEELGGRVVCLDKKPGIQLSLILKMRSVLRELRPDIVHTHQIPTLIYTGLASRWLGAVRIVHTEHGLPAFANRTRTRWISRLSGIHCALFFCLTEEIAREVRKYWIVAERKICTIRNGIETANYGECGDPHRIRRLLGISTDATVIGTVGRLVEIKQYDLLIRSFVQVAQSCLDAHLVFVGEGPEKSSLRQLAEGLGVGQRVHFVGYQTNVNEYLHAMNCFALTSRSEGTPQAVLEASIARLPVVASRVGGLPEIIDDGKTGLLVPPGDEEALTRAIMEVVQNKELACRLGEAASLRVHSKYGISRMAKEYHNYYLKLLANQL